MRSFKKIAEELQKQSETRRGIDALEIRNLFAELILEISAEMHNKREYDAVSCLLEIYLELRTLKNKDHETKENSPG